MFLIVEGLHSVGKSTLISGLQGHDYKLFECRRLFKELLSAKNTDVSNFSFGTNCAVAWFAKRYSFELSIVFDRLHLSEYAYSILFRDADKQKALEQFVVIDNILSETNCKMIFLTCDYDIVSKRFEAKNAVYNYIHFMTLVNLFNDVLHKTKLLHKIIDISTLSIDEVLQQALAFIKDK